MAAALLLPPLRASPPGRPPPPSPPPCFLLLRGRRRRWRWRWWSSESAPETRLRLPYCSVPEGRLSSAATTTTTTSSSCAPGSSFFSPSPPPFLLPCFCFFCPPHLTFPSSSRPGETNDSQAKERAREREMSSSAAGAHQQSQSRAIPTRTVPISDSSQLPHDYCTTPGGTLFSTTPGGTRIIYDRKFLLDRRNSPMAQTPPCHLPNIPGVTSPGSLNEDSKVEVNNLNNHDGKAVIGDDAQFEMDI